KLTPTRATFAIPQGSTVTWTLNLWSAGQLLGTASGTGGSPELTVSVPAGTDCHLQADVLRNEAFFAGAVKTFTTCGPTTPTTTAPTTTTVPTSPGGGSTTTTVMPVTSPGGGSKTGAVMPVTSPGGSQAPSPSSLAFTGPSPGLWGLLLAGLVLVDLGSLVLLLQPTARFPTRATRARNHALVDTT